MIISEILSVQTNEIYILYHDSDLAVKNPPTHAEDLKDTGLIPELGRSPGVGNGDPLPVFLSWTEPGGLQSMGTQRVRHNLATEHAGTFFFH